MNDDGESGDQIFVASDDFNPKFSKDLNPELDPLGTQCKNCNIRYKDFLSAVNHCCMPFKCIQCNTAFSFDYQLKMHHCTKKNSDRTDTACSARQEDSVCTSTGCVSSFADSKLLLNRNSAKKKNKNCLMCGKTLSSKCLGIYCGGCRNKAKVSKYSLRCKNPLSVSSTSLSELSSNDATSSSSETQNAFNACNQLKKMLNDFNDEIESSDLSESNASSALILSKRKKRMNGSRKKSATASKTTKNNCSSKEKDEECNILSNKVTLRSESVDVISNSKDKLGESRYSLRCERVNKIAPLLSISETSPSHGLDDVSENNSAAVDEFVKTAKSNSTFSRDSSGQEIDDIVSNLPKGKKNDVVNKVFEDGDLKNHCDNEKSVKSSDTNVINMPRSKSLSSKGRRNKAFKCSERNNVKCVEMQLSNLSSESANLLSSTNNPISGSMHLSAADTAVDGENAGHNVHESMMLTVNQNSESRDSLLCSNKITVSPEKNLTSKSKNKNFKDKSNNMNEILLNKKSNKNSKKSVASTSLQKSVKNNPNILLKTLQTKENIVDKKIISNNIAKFKCRKLPKEQNLISEALALDSSQPSTSKNQKVPTVKKKRSATPSDSSFEANSTQKVRFSCGPPEDTCSKTKPKTTPCDILSPELVPAGNSEIIQLDTLFQKLPHYGAVVSKVLTDGSSGYRCPKCNHPYMQIKKATDHSRSCQIFKLIKKTSISYREVEFVCTSCYQHWSSLRELHNHKNLCPVLSTKSNVQISDFIHSYDKTNKYVCPKCSYSCLSSYKFSQHPCKKKLEIMKTCFVKMEKIREHDLRHVEGLFKVECPTCQGIFSDNTEFEIHAKMHVNVGLNAAKSQVDQGKAYAKKEIKKVIQNNKNCSSVDDMVKTILEPVSEILACMDSNNAFPDFNVDIPLPYEQQKLFHEAVKHVLIEKFADEKMDCGDKTLNVQEILGLENLFPSTSCNSEGHTSSGNNQDSLVKDFVCKCVKETVDPQRENKPCLKCLNEYMSRKLNESSQESLSAQVARLTSVQSNSGSSLALMTASDLLRNLASCSNFSAMSLFSDLFATELSGCSTASSNSEAAFVLPSVSQALPKSQTMSVPGSSTLIQDTEESSISPPSTSESGSNISFIASEENRIFASSTSENNNATSVSEMSTLHHERCTPGKHTPSTSTFTNADECNSSTQSDCKIVYCYLPPNSAFSLDQTQMKVELKTEIKPEETFGTEFENMLPIVKVIQDESKTDKVVLYPKIETDCKNSVKRKLYMEKLAKMCQTLVINSELLQPLKPEVLESCRCTNALCDCNRVPSPQLCERDQAYIVLDDTQSTPLTDRKIVYWVFEKLMDLFLKEENDFSVSFVMFPPFFVTVSIHWYLDRDTVYSVFVLKETMQFACATCIEELSVSTLLEHVIEKHKECIINILIA